MKKIKFLAFFFMMIFFLSPCICYSRVITVGFNAEVTEVYDTANLLPGKIEVGDLINGTYIYDTSMEYLLNYGVYNSTSQPAGLRMQTGNFLFETDPNDTQIVIHLYNNSPHILGPMDVFNIRSDKNLIFYGNVHSNEFIMGEIEIDLSNIYGWGGIPYSLIHNELPAIAIKPSDWPTRKIHVTGYKQLDQQSVKSFYIEGLLTAATLISKPPKIIYVDDDAIGTNDGSSWENAYPFLQDAIADANISDKPVEIRVACGIYQPDMGAGIIPGDREASFHLISQVSLNGGYAGLLGPDPDVQSNQLYKTILTGDLNGDDVNGFINRSDNSYHVLSAIKVDDSTYLEGLFITGGYADGLPANATDPSQRLNDHSIRGGGLYVYQGHPVIQSCTFKDNFAYGYGGGIYLYGSSRIINCNFSGNKVGLSGGAVCFGLSDRHSGDISFRDCILQGNTSVSGTESFIGHIAYSNCTLADNLVETQNLDVVNCIIWNREQNLPIFNSLRYSDINNESYLHGLHNINSDPLFASPGYWDKNGKPEDPNDDFWVEGDYHLKSQAGRFDPNTQKWIQDDVTSPCIDAGDPNSPVGYEPFPNGGYINMGAYGGTSEASKSYFGKPICETIVAGDINGDCKVDQTDLDILMLHWLEDHNLY